MISEISKVPAAEPSRIRPASIARPPDPDALSDAEWADYLFNRSNPRGAHRELWNHAQGCRRWFGVERDTVTYRISSSYRLPDGSHGGGD
jgi:sarcosine oxidase subunit delta